jgi:hypothetical protein
LEDAQTGLNVIIMSALASPEKAVVYISTFAL